MTGDPWNTVERFSSKNQVSDLMNYILKTKMCGYSGYSMTDGYVLIQSQKQEKG